MNIYRYNSLLAFFLFSACISAQAEDQIIDFNDLALPDASGVAIYPVPYTQHGYLVTTDDSSQEVRDAFLGMFGPMDPGWTGEHAVFQVWQGAYAQLRRDDATAFDLLAIDLSEYRNQPVFLLPNLTTVTFTGEKIDGSTVTQTFQLDGVFGFETFSFTGFENLRSVQWDIGPDGIASFHQFDNIRVRADADADADGMLDSLDNCPSVYNPDQLDSNWDTFGDACVSTRAVISPGASIGRGAVIGSGTVIANGVSIGRNAHIGSRVIIKRHVRIGDNATIGDGCSVDQSVKAGNNLLLGSNVHIGKEVILGAGDVIGDNTRIGKSSVIGNNVRIGVVGGGYGVLLGKQVKVASDQVIDDGLVYRANTTVP